MYKLLKGLLGLLLLCLFACGDDSSSGANSGSANLVDSDMMLACSSAPLDENSDRSCGNFVLNEVDSTISYSMMAAVGWCDGPDSLHLSWKSQKITGTIISHYSIHGDTLYIRTLDEDSERDYDYDNEEWEIRKQLALVTVLWSPEHDGIIGTWRYVTQYHESENIYVNPQFDNIVILYTFTKDAMYQKAIENPSYNFMRTELVEELLLGIYDKKQIYVSPVDAGYFSKLYPYNSSRIDIQMLSSSGTDATFMVKGKKVLVSNVDVELNYFNLLKVSFDVELDEKKCSYNVYHESISEKNCRVEYADKMYLEKEWDEKNWDEIISVEGVEVYFEDNRQEFLECLGLLD